MIEQARRIAAAVGTVGVLALAVGACSSTTSGEPSPGSGATVTGGQSGNGGQGGQGGKGGKGGLFGRDGEDGADGADGNAG